MRQQNAECLNCHLTPKVIFLTVPYRTELLSSTGHHNNKMLRCEFSYVQMYFQFLISIITESRLSKR